MAIQFTGGQVKFNANLYALYDFSSFTFGMGTFVTGAIGPTYQQLLTYYTASAQWASNTQYFTSSKFGFQIWTAPANGTYEIEVAGSRAGRPNGSNLELYGRGAIVKGNYQLTQGQKVIIITGQYDTSFGTSQPSSSYQGMGGGGGSFLLDSASLAPIMVAGGGGGNARYSSYALGALFVGRDGVTTTSGSASRQGAKGGIGGFGGNSSFSTGSVSSSNNYDGGGGAGLYGDGQNGNGTFTKPYTGTTEAEGGYGILRVSTPASGGLGGRMSTNWGTPTANPYKSGYAASMGGFGGGGGGNGIISAGGGGGYSGGGGSYSPTTTAADGGGGGGSYIVTGVTNVATSDGRYDGLTSFSGSSITNLATYNTGSGYIRITKL
jgi:hypothetical protein